MSKIYEAIVDLSGMTSKVTVTARDAITAKKMLEAQYGKNNVKSGVYQIS